jgi:hypothetical protein
MSVMWEELINCSIISINFSWLTSVNKTSRHCCYRRWEDNIKMDLQEVGGGRGAWMELAQDRDRWWVLVGTVRDFRVP